MSPIDYLRAMVGRQRKLATGDTIHPKPAQLGIGPAGYLMQATEPRIQAEATFTPELRLREPTAAEIEQFRQRLQSSVELRAPRMELCPCIAIYTRCYCKPNTSAILDA